MSNFQENNVLSTSWMTRNIDLYIFQGKNVRRLFLAFLTEGTYGRNKLTLSFKQVIVITEMPYIFSTIRRGFLLTAETNNIFGIDF